MIARLQGLLVQKTPPLVLVDCHGVGYECEVPMSTFYQLPELNQPITLMMHYVVREDAHLLFGFATERERSAFRQLLKVNGIGAKSALAILSGLSVEDLANAIALQEVGLLTRIPGIGKKTAERLLLELKDKFLPDAISLPSGSKAIGNDVLNALLALGYSEKECLLAVKQLGDDVDVSDGIRQALKLLAKS
jgi:Holliday junction DNA helicase RuvA